MKIEAHFSEVVDSTPDKERRCRTPPGEGWFIDLENGEHIRIFEHAQAVKEAPERFRIDPAVASEMVLPRDRRKILMLALSRGFVRVRASRGDVVMEFDHPDRNRVFRVLKDFIRRHGFVEGANLRINALNLPDAAFRGNAKNFLMLPENMV